MPVLLRTQLLSAACPQHSPLTSTKSVVTWAKLARNLRRASSGVEDFSSVEARDSDGHDVACRCDPGNPRKHPSPTTRSPSTRPKEPRSRTVRHEVQVRLLKLFRTSLADDAVKLFSEIQCRGGVVGRVHCVRYTPFSRMPKRNDPLTEGYAKLRSSEEARIPA